MYYIVELEESQDEVEDALQIICEVHSLSYNEIVLVSKKQLESLTIWQIPKVKKLFIGSDQYNKEELCFVYKILYGDFLLVSIKDLVVKPPNDFPMFNWNKSLEKIFDRNISHSEIENSFENVNDVFKVVFSQQRMAILKKEYLSPLKRFLIFEKKLFQLEGGNSRSQVISIGVMNSSNQSDVFKQLKKDLNELRIYLQSIKNISQTFHENLEKLINKRLLLLKKYEVLTSFWSSDIDSGNFPQVFLWHIAFLDRLSLKYKQNGDVQVGILFLVRQFEYFLTGYLFYEQKIFKSADNWFYDDYGHSKKISGLGQLFKIYRENYANDPGLSGQLIPKINSMISVRNASYIGHGAGKFKSSVYDELYPEVSQLIKYKLSEINSFELFDELKNHHKINNEHLTVKNMWEGFFNRISIKEV